MTGLLRLAIPLDDARLRGLGVNDSEATQVVPGNPSAATVIARELAADFLGNRNRLGHGIVTEEIRPVRLGVGEARFGDVGLLDETHALIPADLAVHNHLEALVHILMDGFQIILERAERGRMSERKVVILHVRRDIALFHRVHDELHMVLAKSNAVGASGRSVDIQRAGVGGGSGDVTQLGGVELCLGQRIERLFRVVLENLVDDLLHRLLGQVIQLAGIRDRIQIVIARLFIRASCDFAQAQTISSLSGRAFVDGVSFPHRLVVEPSASLGLSAYIRGLAADCPILTTVPLWGVRL